MKRRVVITGLGAITPIGLTVDEYRQSLFEGKNGIVAITRFETDERYASRIAGEVKNFDATKYFDRKEIRRLDLFAQYGIAASIDAIADSGLNLDSIDPERVGVIASSGIGGMETLEK